MPQAEKLLTVKDVQAALQVCRETVRRLTRLRRPDGRPELPAVRIGRAVRFRPADVERLVERGVRGWLRTG